MVRWPATPTATGDSFTNSVAETGTTTPRAGTGETGNGAGHRRQSVTQTINGGTLTKAIEPRADAEELRGQLRTRRPSSAATRPRSAFRKGDRICFEITARRSRSKLRPDRPILVDFLPVVTAYEAPRSSSARTTRCRPTRSPSTRRRATRGVLTWTLGAPEPDGSLAVPKGAVFQARFSVTSPSGRPARRRT